MAALVEISRKWMCVLLSCVFMLNSGCYSLQVVSTIKKENATTYFEMDSIRNGLLVRIHFEEFSGGPVLRREGRVIQITDTELIIKQYGYRVTHATSLNIPFSRIVMIDLLDKHLNVVQTFIGATIAGVVISFIISLILFGQFMKDFDYKKTPLVSQP